MTGQTPGTQVLFAGDTLRVLVFLDDATDAEMAAALSGTELCITDYAWRSIFFLPGILSDPDQDAFMLDPLANPPVYSKERGELSLSEFFDRCPCQGVLPVIVEWLKQRALDPEGMTVADAFGNSTSSQDAARMGLFYFDPKVLREVMPKEGADSFFQHMPLTARIEAYRTGLGGSLSDLDTVDAKFEPDGVKFLFPDWSDSDLLMVFSRDGRQRNDRENAKTVFDGNAYEWFDSDYTTPLKDALRYHSLSKEAWAAVGAALVAQGSEIEQDTEDDVEVVPVTDEMLASDGVEQCLLAVNDHDDHDPVVEAVEQAYDRASQQAREDECYKGYREAIEDVLGGKGAYEGNELVFKLSYALFAELLEGYHNENGEEFTYHRGSSIVHLVQYTEDKASVPDNYDASPSDEDFSAAVLEMIHEL